MDPGAHDNYMPMPPSDTQAILNSQPLLGRYKTNKTLSKSIF